MQSAIHSTCCSMETIMLLSTDGLVGPVIVKRFGKPAIAEAEVRARALRPGVAQRGPRAPVMSTASRAPVIASNPVASTIASNSCSASVVRMPRSVIASERRAAQVDEVDVVAG